MQLTLQKRMGGEGIVRPDARSARASGDVVFENPLGEALTIFATTNLAAPVGAFVVDPGHAVNNDQRVCRVAHRAPPFRAAAVSRFCTPFYAIPRTHDHLLGSISVQGEIGR